MPVIRPATPEEIERREQMKQEVGALMQAIARRAKERGIEVEILPREAEAREAEGPQPLMGLGEVPPPKKRANE